MILAGNWEVLPEMKGDPVNDIPRFSGHPTGGPVYSDTKQTPWIEASKGKGMESDARYGFGGEDTLAMNKQDWLNSIRTRKRPFCEVEDGHRVSVACLLANMSLKLVAPSVGIRRRNRSLATRKLRPCASSLIALPGTKRSRTR